MCFILLTTPSLRMAQKPLTELWNRSQVQIQKMLVTSISDRSLFVRIGSSQHIIQLMAKTFDGWDIWIDGWDIWIDSWDIKTDFFNIKGRNWKVENTLGEALQAPPLLCGNLSLEFARRLQCQKSCVRRKNVHSSELNKKTDTKCTMYLEVTENTQDKGSKA